MSKTDERSLRSLDYRTFLKSSTVLNEFVPYIRTAIIVDANVILGELRWMVRNPGKESTLFQLASSKKVIAWITETIVGEIEEHLMEVVQGRDVPVDEVERAWGTYRGLLRILPDTEITATEVLESQLQQRDADDLPTLRGLYAFRPDYLISRDKDIHSLQIDAGDPLRLWIDLRDYHTAQSMRISLEVIGGFIGLGSVGALYAIFQAVKALGKLLAKSPSWIKISLGLFLMAVFTFPRSRSRVIRQLRQMATQIQTFSRDHKGELQKGFSQLIESLEAADKHEEDACNRLGKRRVLSVPSPKTARDFALHVLVRSHEPLSATQLARKVQQAGFRTKNKRFDLYLHQILRHDGRLQRLPDGRWTVESTRDDAVPTL